MAKSNRLTGQLRIEEFASRRVGATYFDASSAARDRLMRLRQEYKDVPEAYRGYITVGICSCLESHMKYCYASAAERFSGHGDLLKQLYKDISVDIDTLVSTTSRTFHLADVVAASIKISSLAAYREKASHFFSVFTGKPHDFPWDFVGLTFGGDPQLKKAIAEQISRLERVFTTRHNFVHETDILGRSDHTKEVDDPIVCLDDALLLVSQFEKQFEDIQMSPRYSAIRPEEGLAEAVARNLKEIDEQFERIKADCEIRQHDQLENLKEAFVRYIWARCDFQASVFIAQRSEASMAFFLNSVPEFCEGLRDLGPRQKYMLSQYPVARQYADMGLEPDGTMQRESTVPGEGQE